MKKVILIFVVFLYFIQLNAIITETADLYDFFFSSEPACAYSKWESHIVEGIASEGYNMYAPYDRQTDGFGQFTLPTEAQSNAWESAVDYFFAEEYNDAQNVFVQNNIPYSVVKFIDGANIYYMLRENLNSSYVDNNGTTPAYDDEIGSFDFGWGIFIYRSTTPNPIVVSAPHPNDDFISTYFSVKSFLDFDSQYLMINGSGREVMWSEYGNYNNGKSYSDPSRNSNHPFNYFYEKACDKIRENYDRRELSVQFHSYDWDSHPNKASCQISPGQFNRPAGLPIRDFSALRQDVIQNTDYIVVPSGTIGNNTEVTVTDYYSVYNMFFDTYYNDTILISNDVDLPGYQYSFHDYYSTANYSDWDVFSPFFHVELDELPNCYDQNEESFREFYGYNSYSNNWNTTQRFTKLNQYYEPFIEGLESAIASWVEFDDGQVPEAPTNLRRFYGSSGNAIAWDTASCYDFYSYEILYSLNPISDGQYSILNRNNNDKLAFPAMDNSILPNLQLNQTYYIAIRTSDYNGNTSSLSEELIYTTLPITTSEFEVFANNNSIEIEWTMNQQQSCVGFEVYRSQDESNLELYVSYVTDDDLEINSSSFQNYVFEDTNVEIGHSYSYRVNVVISGGQSNEISQVMNASLANYISLNSTGNSWNESVVFGKSIFSTEGYEYTYDELINDSNNYLALAFNDQKFSRNIISDFEPTDEVHYFDLIIDSPPSNLTFSINPLRSTERFYLLYNEELYSLNNQNAVLSFPEDEIYSAKLIWGNLQPTISFGEASSSIIYEGATVEFVWNVDYPELVQSTDLSFFNQENTFLIAEDLPPEQTTFTFINDINENQRLMNLSASVTSTDNQTSVFKSYNSFVLISEIEPLNLLAENSNQLLSYPFTDEYDLSLLNENIEAFSFWNEEYSVSDNLNHNNGFFINIFDDCQVDYNGLPVLIDEQYQINRGWNLINNIHPIDYQVKDLLFEKNGVVNSYKNAYENDYIFPTIFGIRDGAYTPISTIKAFESAFLCQISNDILYVRFDPVNQAENISFNQPDLFFTLEFKSLSGAKDELTVGLQSDLTPMIDFYYDAIKPPLRPTYGLKEACIISDPPLSSYYPKLHKKLLEPTEEDSYSWNISFTNTLEEAVQVRVKAHNNSNNYPLDLVFGGEVIRLSEEFITINNTEESGTFYANLTMMTVTNNSDNDVEPVSYFQVSPNPISKEAKIKISNVRNKDYSITVYNLKGQRVKGFDVKDSKIDNGIISWDLTNDKQQSVSSGIYFIKFKDAYKSNVRKVCVIKQ